jgi:hypothetical protein
MILPFNPQFKPLILDGTKIHTIREDKHDRWKVGMKIHMATGVRTKNYKQFAEATVSKITTIRIEYQENLLGLKLPFVYVQDKLLVHEVGRQEMDEIIKNDGFPDKKSFFSWFNQDFTGKIIYWENLKIIE